METYHGNIWDLLPTHHIVIPTNIGWKSDGRNVMGAGLAQQANKMFCGLDEWYGKRCRDLRERIRVVEFILGIQSDASMLLMFPVKPLNKEYPFLSWQAKADLKLIEKSCGELANLINHLKKPVAVPLVGCGNGGLDEKDVLPILERILVHPNFVLVRL